MTPNAQRVFDFLSATPMLAATIAAETGVELNAVRGSLNAFRSGGYAVRTGQATWYLTEAGLQKKAGGPAQPSSAGVSLAALEVRLAVLEAGRDALGVMANDLDAADIQAADLAAQVAALHAIVLELVGDVDRLIAHTGLALP